MKYIDPTYMIRDVPATAFDQQMCRYLISLETKCFLMENCSHLAQNAVHGAMAGWTGFTVGNINGKACYIPLNKLISERRRIEPTNADWQKLLTSTGQPSFLNREETRDSLSNMKLIEDREDSD